MTAAPDFPDLLAAFRADLSQYRLAKASGLDHSTISRLEHGERAPTRDTVLRLATAMRLGPADTDTLLISANYLPTDPLAMIRDEPELVAIYRTLHNPAVPAVVARMMRMQLGVIGRQVEAMTLPVTLRRELDGTGEKVA